MYNTICRALQRILYPTDYTFIPKHKSFQIKPMRLRIEPITYVSRCKSFKFLFISTKAINFDRRH